jgi:hypothetical protein
MKRPLLLYFLCLLHLFTGLSALGGGGMLIIRPDGSLLGMNTSFLKGTPFTTYLLPGWILLVLLGILPVLTASGLFLRPTWTWPDTLNLYKDRHWSWALSIYVGVILIGWITIQITMIPYFWLQPALLCTGLLMLILSLLPSVMKHLQVNAS